MKPYKYFVLWNNDTHKSDIPAVIIVGKRKPTLAVEGNEKKIAKSNSFQGIGNTQCNIFRRKVDKIIKRKRSGGNEKCYLRFSRIIFLDR